MILELYRISLVKDERKTLESEKVLFFLELSDFAVCFCVYGAGTSCHFCIKDERNNLSEIKQP